MQNIPQQYGGTGYGTPQRGHAPMGMGNPPPGSMGMNPMNNMGSMGMMGQGGAMHGQMMGGGMGPGSMSMNKMGMQVCKPMTERREPTKLLCSVVYTHARTHNQFI